MYSVLNTLSEYAYFYISKNITSYTFVACFLKSSKALSVSVTVRYSLQNNSLSLYKVYTSVCFLLIYDEDCTRVRKNAIISEGNLY